MADSYNSNSFGEISTSSDNTGVYITGRSINSGSVDVHKTSEKPSVIFSECDIQTGAIFTVTSENKSRLPDSYNVGDKYMEVILNNPVNTRVLVNMTEMKDIYTAGNGIDISNNVISSTQISAEWGNIEGDLSEQTDLQNALGLKADISTFSQYVPKTQLATISQTGIVKPDGVTILVDSEGCISTKTSRNIGEVVTSAIPLTDSGLHLLDGALISSGSYSAFVDYIGDLYDSGDYTGLFETEANWQTSVTNYGVCGKFVYDSVNNTVRLPKITGFIEGTTDLTALGDLVQAGLPNITGQFNDCNVWSPSASGAISLGSSHTESSKGSGSSVFYGFNFDASDSNSIYGNSNTVQPQAIKVLYYIVIATSSKTDIQVDIDDIATDLNGKADTDLSNISASASAKGAITTWGMPDYTAGVAATMPYTILKNGFIKIKAKFYGSSCTISVNNSAVFGGSSENDANPKIETQTLIPVAKDDIVRIQHGDSTYSSDPVITFYPAKGVE